VDKPIEKRKPFSKKKRILIKFEKKNDELPDIRTKSTKEHPRTILGKDNNFHSLTYLFPQSLCTGLTLILIVYGGRR
jgi:hypothetical protein